MVSSGWPEISRATAETVALFCWRIFGPPSEELGGPKMR